MDSEIVLWQDITMKPEPVGFHTDTGQDKGPPDGQSGIQLLERLN